MTRQSDGTAALRKDDVISTEEHNGSDTATVDTAAGGDTADTTSETGRKPIAWLRLVAYVLLPATTLLVALSAGFLQWQDSSERTGVARAESLRAAVDGTIALLSYKPDTVEQDLEAARSRMTGVFLDSYTSLTHDVVIPGAKQKQISAEATVPAAAPVTASGHHAVALVFVNQTVSVSQDPPASTTSSVRVTLDKIDGRWLISGFDPV